MIKDIFLPEKIGTHRILAQRIIGLSLHANAVHLAYIYAKRGKTIIENLLTEAIVEGNEENWQERAAQSLKKAIQHIKKYDQIRICVPASIVIFKELQLQFNDPAKIRLVLDYEIETMLPFSIQDAVVDFIITKKQKDSTASTVLVAAVRSQDLEQQLAVYEKAGINATSITIDLFAHYNLIQQIQNYYTIPHAMALVEVGTHATRIAFIQQGQLKLTRYIQRGISSLVKLISDEIKMPRTDVEQKLRASGLRSANDEIFARCAQKHFVLLLNDIQFTLNSFSLKLNIYEGITKILFTGHGNNIFDFMTFCSDTMQIPCEFFEAKKIFENKTIKNKIKHSINEWEPFTTVLGVALPSLEQADFDLRRKQFVLKQHRLLTKQIITASIITIIMIATLGIKGYLDISTLSQHIKTLEEREINRIKAEKIFPKNQFPRNPTLNNVIRDADRIVREKLEMWSPFSQQRMRPLSLWFELTRIINKKNFDISIKEVTFSTLEKNWERERDGNVRKDAGIPKIEVEGLFRSKTGSHFTDFIALEERFKESTLLRVCEPYTDHIDSTPADNGVNFTVHMKLRNV